MQKATRETGMTPTLRDYTTPYALRARKRAFRKRLRAGLLVATGLACALAGSLALALGDALGLLEILAGWGLITLAR